MGVLLSDTINWQLKYFTHIYCNMITDAARLYSNGTCVREAVG
jgi:hypothetical protein